MTSTRGPQVARLFGVAAVVALSATLAACAPEASLGAGGVGAPQDDGNSAADSSGATPETEEQHDFGDPASCLVGEWTASNEFFLASIRQFGDEIKSVEGEVVVTFGADGTMVTDYRGWLITAVAEGVTVTIQRTGTDRGIFEATESTVTIQDQQMGSVLQMSGEGFGMTVDGEPAHYVDAAYTCDATAAMVTTPDGAMQMSRR